MLYLFFPIKSNRILFTDSGNSYRCNPKYIFQFLYDWHGNKYEYVWAINNSSAIPSKYKVKRASYLSLRHLYYLATSSVLVSNVGIEPFVPPRKGRIFINTWHGGGAYKMSSISASYYSRSHRWYFKKIRDLRAKSTDYVISTNRVFSEVMSSYFNVPIEKFLSIGMPRNDIFFKPEQEKEEMRQKICHRLNIDEKKTIVLYAPTYRGHERTVKKIDLGLDVPAVCNAVQMRFGRDVVFLYRCHINMKKNYAALDSTIDVSSYPDMQELLLLANIIITDYSSFIWDYAFTYKPGFLYTPDLADYESDVGLYTPIQYWQYPYALTNEQLCSLIFEYEESSATQKINNHLSLIGSYEKGVASKKICDLIIKHVDSMQ